MVTGRLQLAPVHARRSCNPGLELLTTNITGHTKRLFAYGAWFVSYVAGNIAGARIFLTREAPRYFPAGTCLVTCYCGLIAGARLLAECPHWYNKRRVEDVGLDGDMDRDSEAIRAGFEDRIDMESRGIRYTL